MSSSKASVQPERTEQSELKARERCKELRTAVNAEMRSLQKTHSLLICMQYTANYDVEVDISDALAVIVERIDESLAALNLIELEARDD